MTQAVGSRGSAFAVFLVLARLLPPSAFGLFAYAQAFVLVIQSITDNAVSAVVVQRENLRAIDLDSIFWANLSLSCLLTAMGILGGPAMATVLREPELGPILQVLSVTILIAGLSGVQIGVLRREFDFKAVALRSVGGEVVGGVIAIAAVIAGADVWGLVIQRLVATATGSVILWLRSSWRPHLRFSAAVLRDVGGFAASVVGSRVLWVSASRVDDIIIGYFLGPVALGYYTVAHRITRFLTQLLSGTVLQVALSTFSRLQEQRELLRRGLLSALRLGAVVSVPFFLWLIVVAEPLTEGLFGERWLPTVPVMRVLAIIGLVHSLRTIGEAVLVALGRPSWWMRLEFTRIALMVAGYLLVVHHGILAVAGVLVLSQCLSVPVLIAMISGVTGLTALKIIRQYWAALASTALMLAATIAALVVLIDRLPPLVTAIVCAAVAVPVYWVALSLLNQQTVRQVWEYAGSLAAPRDRESGKRG